MFHNPYHYEQRIDELAQISSISNEGEKEEALKAFITDEKAILAARIPPSQRSQALDSAIKKLDAIENPVEQPNCARALFIK